MPAEALKVALFLAPVQPIFANHNTIDQSFLRFSGPPRSTLRAKQVGNRTVRCHKLAVWPQRLVPHCKGPAHRSGGQSGYRDTLVFPARPYRRGVTRTAVTGVRRVPKVGRPGVKCSMTP